MQSAKRSTHPNIMLPDIKRLFDTLPPSAQMVASHVYHTVCTGQICASEETRSSLALTAALREVVESHQIDIWIYAGINKPVEFVNLLGFADAFSRRAIALRLNINQTPTLYIARGIGNNRVSHSRRINGIFRTAVAYAEKI